MSEFLVAAAIICQVKGGNGVYAIKAQKMQKDCLARIISCLSENYKHGRLKNKLKIYSQCLEKGDLK